ncbi:MAG TPA: amino acid ABC transporter substrate-binding protein [Candidatus Sulfotelmatobacter sp.]|nr:amino acid ABC transporter substrate-binding protein [Candidatus Sulfotelmatobacter sp.]
MKIMGMVARSWMGLGRLAAAGAVVLAMGVLGLGAPRDAAAQQKTPIKVGASLSLTGQLSRSGVEQEHGYKLWEQEVNARGGLLGRPVELVLYDDKSDPATGAKLYEKLITVDKVDLLEGPYSSPVTKAASAITEKYRFPMLSTGGSARDIFERGFRYIFQVATPSEYYMVGAVEIGAKHGAKTMVVVSENTVFTQECAKGAQEHGKKLGIQTLHYEEYSRGVTDLAPLILKSKQLKPDMFIACTYGPEAILFTRQMKDLDFSPKLFGFSVGVALPDYAKGLGQDAEAVFGSSQWEPGARLPGAKEFAEKFRKAFNFEPSYHAAQGYVGGLLMEKAVNETKSLDKEKIRDYLAKLDTVTLYGRYKVNDKGLQIGKPAYLIQVQDGRRAIVWPDDAAEAKYIYPFPGWKK